MQHSGKRGSHRFFSNEDCEYFPCHPTDIPSDFNCLFCYCPLYVLGEKCGGQFRYTEQGVKDCSACMLPHTREACEYINGKFQEIDKAMKRLSELEKEARRQARRMRRQVY